MELEHQQTKHKLMEVDDILNILSDLNSFGAGETPLQRRLTLIRKIQKEIPSSHVGGSIGLFLHGIDLGRNFIDSDLDLALSHPTCNFLSIENVKSDKERFYQKDKTKSCIEIDEIDYFADVNELNNQCEIKVEFKYDKTQTYKTIEFEGHSYRVTSKKTILGWKVLFASRGSKKHIDDLNKIGVVYPDLKYRKFWKNKYKTWEELEEDLVQKKFFIVEKN